jgi:hypothetical protein
LALSLVDVITQEHLAITETLIDMDLIALLVKDDTFAIKAIVARIIRTFLFAEDTALSSTILASDAFREVLGALVELFGFAARNRC